MYKAVKSRLLLIIKKLSESNVIPSNALICVKDNESQCFALNDTTIPFNEVAEDNVIIIDFNSNIISGKAEKKDEYFTVGKAIFDQNSEINTIIIPRSRWNCIWSELGMSLSPSSFFYCKYFSGEILCTNAVTLEPDEDLYEIISKNIVERLRNKGLKSQGAVIVRNDGAIIWGKNDMNAVERAIAFEEICFRAVQTAAITNGGSSFVAWEVSERLLKKD